MTFKKLNIFLMLFGSSQCTECSEISAFPGLGILLPGIEPVFARFKLSDHNNGFSYFLLYQINASNSHTCLP
jgi:hypothetical protein